MKGHFSETVAEKLGEATVSMNRYKADRDAANLLVRAVRKRA